MQTAALQALEFDRIVESVRGFALTPMGDAALRTIAPSADRAEVAERQAATTEAVDYLAKQSAINLRGSADLPAILESLTVEGRALEAPRLLVLATFLDSVDDVRRAIRRVAGTFPRLERSVSGAASFTAEIADVRAKIDPAGEVVDDATPELRSIRDRLRRQKTKLRGALESYLRGRDTAKYLQDQVVTERNGRYVLVVRAEHRTSIPGLVHGASTSGASVYLEPLATVEINNDIVALEEQEAEEVRRILLALTDTFRARPLDLVQTVEAATALDILQARARFSQAVDGVAPILSVDGTFDLVAARHPLLKAPVAVNIRIVPPATVLLITGPNTGGKTVALKTAGLLALMAQSGLRVPAATGSVLPVFRSMFADIGDEQSIEASLSTFSAHIARIAAMDRMLETPALVLLDEVGSGTDPVEGGALGVAIIDHFRQRGATVMATSHYDALKSYASTTAGVQSAAFGFDAATFAPTYALIYGSPGRSLALEIAARLGLNPSLIAAARRNVSERDTRLAAHLARMDDDMRALDDERRRAVRERETAEAQVARLRQREEALRLREEQHRRKLTDEMNGQLRAARREIDAVIDGLKKEAATLAREAASRHVVSTGAAGAARTAAKAAVEAIGRRTLDPIAPVEPPETESAQPAAVGDRVIVGGLGIEGVVTAVQGQGAEVDVRGKRMKAALRDLRRIGAGGAAPGGKAAVRVNVSLNSRDGGSADLNLVGCTVDEALGRTERFLDDLLLDDRRSFRVIHGFGTGQLRRALSEYLQKHPLVARVQLAGPDQGGGGVTLVELKD